MNIYKASWINAWLTIKSSGQKMLLGIFWIFFEPVFVSFVMTMALSAILEKDFTEYFSYVFIGKVLFIYFSKNISLASSAISGNTNISFNVDVRPFFFILSSIHRVTIQITLSILILLITVKSMYGVSVIQFINFFLIILVFYLFVVAFCSVLAIFGCFIPDISAIIAILILPLMFVSGIFFPIDNFDLNPGVISALSCSPIYILITDAREILINYENFVFSFHHQVIFWSSCFVIIFSMIFSDRYRAHLTYKLIQR